MRYLKVVSIELVPNGKEYKLSNDTSMNNAALVSIRARRVGFTLNGKAIASSAFDAASLTLKVNTADVITNLPLATIEQIDKATGKGFETNLKNIDWSESLIKIQNAAAAVVDTAIELVLEFEK